MCIRWKESVFSGRGGASGGRGVFSGTGDVSLWKGRCINVG